MGDTVVRGRVVGWTGVERGNMVVGGITEL